MRIRKKIFGNLVFFVFFMAVSQGCGSSTGGVLSTRVANLNLTGTKVTALSQFSVYDALTRGDFELFAVGDSASSTATGITSLKYIFGDMTMCDTLTTSGSSFTTGSGGTCITFYSSGLDTSTMTETSFTTYSTKAFDMMDSTSLASFNTTATGTVVAGSFNYVAINWAPYISVKGSVAVGGGTTLTTQTCTVNTTSGLCKSTSALTTATATEAIVKSANGGSYFKFQNPFVISASDVSAKTAYTIDLVFNPEAAVAAAKGLQLTSTSLSGIISDQTAGTANANGIYVPMIQLTPVPRKTTQTTSKETYNVTLNPTSLGTARVELYYVTGDTSKTIYGVNVINTLSTTQNGNFFQIDNGAKITSVTTASDGTLTLKTTDGTTVISGLARSANSTVTVNTLGGMSSALSGSSTYVSTVEMK